MAPILNSMKRGMFRAFIKISAPSIVRQLHRGILGRAPHEGELFTCVKSIRKSGGKIGPVLKRLLKSEEFRSRSHRIRMPKPAAKDTAPEQRVDDLPKSPPPDSGSPADLRKKIAFLGASVTGQARSQETGEITGYVEAFRENHSAELGFEEVIVLAYPGNRLTDAGLIHAQEILERKPNVVILELTVEDRSRGCDFDERHLAYLTRIFLAGGILPVFFALPKPDRDDPAEDSVIERIRQFAEAVDLPFFAPHLPPGSQKSDFYRDKAHTNSNGALYYSDALAGFLKDLSEKGIGKKKSGFSFRKLKKSLKQNIGYGNWFRMHANPAAFQFHISSIETPKSGDFKTIVIRNHAPKQAGGSIRIIQKQEIGPHSPVVDVAVLPISGGWRTHQASIWDPYCHYSRHSYVTLAKVDGHDFKKIKIKVSSTLPNYADCKREHDNDLPHAELCMRSDQPIWVISDSAVNLGIAIRRR